MFENLPDNPLKNITEYPTNYRFNLPPHNWSLITKSSQLDNVPGGPRRSLFNSASKSSFDRRGRMWRYGDLLSLQGGEFNSNLNSSPADKKGRQGKKGLQRNDGSSPTRKDDKYGFQFLWNPTSYGTSTAISNNVVASANDSYAAGNVFQGTGTISFEIHLNRINDFACFKSTSETDLSRYYGPISGYEDNNNAYLNLFKDLKERGTLADLEFLYRMVNGSAVKNLANRETSDIGILIPQLIRVDIGPYSQVGSITGLSVAHQMFTEDMIPIMSTVNISVQVVSNYGYNSNLVLDAGSGGDGGNPNNPNPLPQPKISLEKQRTQSRLRSIERRRGNQ